MESTRKGVTEYALDHGWEQRVSVLAPGTVLVLRRHEYTDAERSLYVHLSDHGRVKHAVTASVRGPEAYLRPGDIKAHLKAYGS